MRTTIRERLAALERGRVSDLATVTALVRLADGTEKEYPCDRVPEGAEWLDIIVRTPEEAGRKRT